MASEEYLASILWHDMWIKGPLIGVAEYKGENVIYSRKNGKYELRRFKEDGYKKAERAHLAYRANYGGHRDHVPELFTPHKLGVNNSVTNVFDYKSHSLPEVIAVLEQKDFKWFYPPKKHTPNFSNKSSDFDATKNHGEDIGDESSSSEEENNRKDD